MSGPRTCKCGCGTSLDGRRAGAMYASPACRMAYNRGTAPANANTTRTGGPSGPQLAFRRMCNALVQRYDEDPKAVEAFLASLLSDRQRKQLEARRAP